MLVKLLIENYKSIEKAEFEFSKINLLIGPNGSGKSSVIESADIMLFNREYILPRSSSVSRGTIVQVFSGLKSFASVVHNHDSTRKIRIQGKFANSPILAVRVDVNPDKASREIVTPRLGLESLSSVDVEISRLFHILRADRKLTHRLSGVTASTYNVDTQNTHQLFYYACYRSEFKENIEVIREFYSRYGLHNIRWVPTEKSRTV